MRTVKPMKTVSDFGLLKVNVTKACKLSNIDEFHRAGLGSVMT